MERVVLTVGDGSHTGGQPVTAHIELVATGGLAVIQGIFPGVSLLPGLVLPVVAADGRRGEIRVLGFGKAGARFKFNGAFR